MAGDISVGSHRGTTHTRKHSVAGHTPETVKSNTSGPAHKGGVEHITKAGDLHHDPSTLKSDPHNSKGVTQSQSHAAHHATGGHGAKESHEHAEHQKEVAEGAAKALDVAAYSSIATGTTGEAIEHKGKGYKLNSTDKSRKAMKAATAEAKQAAEAAAARKAAEAEKAAQAAKAAKAPPAKPTVPAKPQPTLREPHGDMAEMVDNIKAQQARDAQEAARARAARANNPGGSGVKSAENAAEGAHGLGGAKPPAPAAEVMGAKSAKLIETGGKLAKGAAIADIILGPLAMYVGSKDALEGGEEFIKAKTGMEKFNAGSKVAGGAGTAVGGGLGMVAGAGTVAVAAGSTSALAAGAAALGPAAIAVGGGVAVVDGVKDIVHGFAEGKPGEVGKGTLKTLAGGAMIAGVCTGNPILIAGGAVTYLGVVAYEHRKEIAAAAGAVVDGAAALGHQASEGIQHAASAVGDFASGAWKSATSWF